MALSSFAYDSERARLARLNYGLKRYEIVLYIVSALLFVLGATMLIVLQASAGWFITSLGIWPLLLIVWRRRGLSELSAGASDSYDGRLEVDLLGRLPKNLTPQLLATKLSEVTSAQFVMVRSGVSMQMLGHMIDDDPKQLQVIWSMIRDMQPSGIVKASTVVAAFVKSNPEIGQLLPHLQLEESDLHELSEWYGDIGELIKKQRHGRLSGGVARDWNFGYLRLLERFGINLSDHVTRGGSLSVDTDAHTASLQYMKQVFSGGGRQNVALVGPLGVGKTKIVQSFAEQLMLHSEQFPASLRYRQVVSLSASSLISAARGRGELEELLNALLLEAYHAKNVILCLDDAELFFEEGVGSVDLSRLLLPILDGGVLRIILTMDEQRWLQISARNPGLVAPLNKFMVGATSDDQTIKVLEQQLMGIEFQQHVTYMYQALKESLRLSERYFYDQAQPGKALKVLSMAAQFAENGVVTAASVKQAVERSSGVKVGGASVPDEREMLLGLEDLIHQRMVNQTRAVHVVSDALRRARAGVRNEKRPVGTFLFLGPTGTGKTELAKSLAAVYFGGEDRLIRLDLNEFVRTDDVTRLIADAATDPMSLSAQVLKQPFSVILLDEIEKAHPSVLASLLQVLDEGILRDSAGREVSFRDTIVIATSNAGSDQIRHHIEAGEKPEDFEVELARELVTSGQFRPEFLNRFDEIVVFKPLGREELQQIIDLMIAGVNQTLQAQQVVVAVDESAKAKLIELGYDPQLGARPLRRAVQRTVESLVAKCLLSGELQPGQTLTVTAADITE